MAAVHDLEKTNVNVNGIPDQNVPESFKEENIGTITGPETETETEPDRENQVEIPPQLPAVPDGGLIAWLQVLGSFFLIFNSWGIVNTFGVFQTYYERDLLSNQSPSNISWIGSIQAFLLLLVGVITGPLYDAGWLRGLLFSGTFLVVFGLMMTSISNTYWQILLAQGICMGIGLGCLFVPSVAIVSTYFSKKRAFAMGIAASGSSLGGVIYPIIFHRLQPHIGFPWSTRILSFLTLFTLTFSLLAMRPLSLPSSRRSLLDLSAFHELPFILNILALFFGFMGLYIPFFYIQSFAITKSIMSPNTAFYLLSIMNFSSIFGRIIPSYLADHHGPLNILIPFTLLASLILFIWLGITTPLGLVLFCIIYGFSSGTFVSLPPPVIVSLSPSPKAIGTRMGMTFALSGLGLLIGTPVAGKIVDERGFGGAIAFCGGCVLSAGGLFLATRVVKGGWRLRTII